METDLARIFRRFYFSLFVKFAFCLELMDSLYASQIFLFYYPAFLVSFAPFEPFTLLNCCSAPAAEMLLPFPEFSVPTTLMPYWWRTTERGT